MTVFSHPGISEPEPPALTVRPVKGFDAAAVAELRSGTAPTPEFVASMRIWLQAEGEPRTTLMATAGGRALGLISALEHREMPEADAPWSRWGYIDHLFVRNGERGRGVGTALIAETIALAERRRWEKVLVSPGSTALSLFHRMGFLMADELGPEEILLLRPWRAKFGAPTDVLWG